MEFIAKISVERKKPDRNILCKRMHFGKHFRRRRFRRSSFSLIRLRSAKRNEIAAEIQLTTQ